MSWISENCKPVEEDGHGVWRIQEEQRQSTSYGMGFGPEGDGVELPPIQGLGLGVIESYKDGVYHKRTSDDDLKPTKAVDATMRWVSPKRDAGSFENIQWPRFTFESDDAYRVEAKAQRLAAVAFPFLGSAEYCMVPLIHAGDHQTNAKPALPALTRQAGEKYKGLGFNDGMGQ